MMLRCRRLVDRSARVSTLELFFDLVFVFTITQLTALLVHRPGRDGRCLQAAACCWP